MERLPTLPPDASATALASTRRALRSLATRWIALDHEARELDRDLNALTKTAADRKVR